MALTRPLLSQLNTNIIAFSDNMMVINAGNVANRDLGMVFDRSVNSQSNVALFWQESSSSFTFAQTTSSGLNNANIVVGLTANVVLGNIILAGNGSAGIFYANGSVFSGGGGGTPGGVNGQLQYNNLGVFAGAAGATFNGTNVSVTGFNVNNSATIGTTLGVSGGIQNTPIGNTTPSTALFTTVGSSGNATVSALTVNANATIGTTLGVTGNVNGSSITLTGSLTARGPGDFDGGLQSTPIGNASASTGVFTSVSAATIGNAGATLTGTIQTAAQTNITSVGTLSSLSVTASNVSVNITDRFNTITSTKNLRIVSGSRDLALIANISGGSYNSLTTSNDSSIIFTGTALGNAAFTISPWAATTSGIRISSVSNVATIRLAATTIQVDGNITNGGTSGTGNIGATGATFNTVFAKATTAQYADLAEIYIADADYPPGTVVVFGGSKEITVTSTAHDTRVAGVISTNPAYLMNSEVQGLPVALTGRVPCLVQGPINKGELLVTGLKPGTAQKINSARFQPGCVIGKSLKNIPDDELKLIEIVVGRF